MTFEKKRLRRPLAAIVLVAAALAPAATVALRAAAGEPAPAKAAIPSEERTQEHLLGSLATDATVLINVSERDMPASPDILALGKKSTPALARCLADSADDSLRRRCADLLGSVGDRAALPALQTAVDDWDPAVRLAAIRALQKIADASSVASLLKELERPDEEDGARVATLAALGAIGNKKAVGVLRSYAKDRSDQGADLRTAAFRALWMSRHLMSRDTLVADVAQALESDNDGLLLAATEASSELRSPRLVAPLIPLLDNKDSGIRNKAVHALGLIGDRGATKALLAKLPTVRDGRMLNNISFALERLDREAFYASIKQVIEHKQAIIRLNAAFVLGDVKRPEGRAMLETALGDPSDLVKTSAVVALGKIGDPAAIPALEKLADSPNDRVREEVVYAVFELSERKRSDLVYDKLFVSPHEGVKRRAARALGEVGDTRVRDYLLACLERKACSPADVDRYVRSDKDPAVGGRILLAWARGQLDLTDVVRDLRPAGTLPLVLSSMDAAIEAKSRSAAIRSVELAGDLGDATARGRLLHDIKSSQANDPWLQLHGLVALARLGDADAEALVVERLDTIAATWLPKYAAVLGRVAEPEVRARLTKELEKRERSAEPAIALASAAVHLAWDPDTAFFRFLDALASQSSSERELATRYLARSEDPRVTALLRRALAREKREDVADRLRELLDPEGPRRRQP